MWNVLHEIAFSHFWAVNRDAWKDCDRNFSQKCKLKCELTLKRSVKTEKSIWEEFESFVPCAHF